MRLRLPLYDAAPDVIAEDASDGIWTEARGVQFRAGMSERCAPAVQQHVPETPDDPILALMGYMNASAEYFWIAAAKSGVYAVNSAGWTEITPPGWAPLSNSILTIHGFNGFVILNDSQKGPYSWAGSVAVPMVALVGWPSGWRCTSMRSHSGFLFAIGRLDMGGGQRVNWSDAAEAGTLPTEWNPTASNLAGFVDLLPAVSRCVDGCAIGNDFLVFKGESVHAFTFAGGTAIFSVRKRFSELGMAGVNGWAAGPSERVLFAGSDGDIYATDGMSLASILQGKAQRTYYDDSDPDAFAYGVAGASLSRVGMSIMAYRRRGEQGMSRAVVYDWATGAGSVRSLPFAYCLAEGQAVGDVTKNSWDSDAGPWSKANDAWDFMQVAATANDVMAGAIGLWLISDRSLSGGIPEPVYLLKVGAALGNEGEAKLVRHVFPRIRGNAGEQVELRIGVTMEAQAAVQWSAAQRFTIGAGGKVDVGDGGERGRFVSIELSSVAGSDAVFSVGSIELEVAAVGKW